MANRDWWDEFDLDDIRSDFRWEDEEDDDEYIELQEGKWERLPSDEDEDWED